MEFEHAITHQDAWCHIGPTVIQVFTVETGGSKRVIVSSYEVFRELLIKNGGITSTRDTLGLTKYLQKVYKQEPGELKRSNTWKSNQA